MSPPSATEPVLAGIARLLAIAGGLVVVALAVVVTASVLMRWLAGSGMDGDFELVQMGLALAGIPHKKGGVQAAMDFLVSQHQGAAKGKAA